jgi:hypothetical protein
VNLARTAPTVHNSAPLGYRAGVEPKPEMSPPHPHPAWTPQEPSPYTPVAPYPGQAHPVAHNIPAPRRNTQIIVAAIVVGFVVVLFGGAVVYLSGSTDGDDPSTPAWGAHQYISDDFPHLVPERYGRGWNQVSCYTGENPRGHEIKCNHMDNSGISFTIEDHSTLSAVQERLNSNEFSYTDFSSGTVHSAETRSAPHPRLAAPAQMTLPPENSSAAVFADAYFSFPADPVRGRYLITVKWPDHTAAEILEAWWSHAPLDR